MRAPWADAVIVALLVLAIAVVAAPMLRARAWLSRFHVSHTHHVRSGLDGAHYKVHLEYAAPEAAADLLAVVHNMSIDLMEHLRAKYVRAGRPGERAAITRRLIANYDPDGLAESSPHNAEGDTSFTLNKGRVLAVCLRERHAHESGDPRVHDLHDALTVMFVAVHELAHLGTVGYNHPPEFWECFKFLLLECVDARIVAGWPNYFEHPVRYCGLTIDYSPLFDPAVGLPA